MKNSILLIIFLIFNLLIVELYAQTLEIDSLNNLLQKHITKDSVRVNLLNEAAYKLYEIDINRAIKCAEEANDLSVQINYAKGIARSLSLIGICYDEKSDYHQALNYYNKALNVYEELNDKSGITKCYNNIGIIYRYQGDYPKALEYYQKSLKIDEELNDLKGVSNSLNNIGIIYEYQEKYLKALEYYQKSLKIKEDLGIKNGVATSCYNIGTIYLYQNEYSEAYEYYQRALEISIDIGRQSTETFCYEGLAKLFLAQGNVKEAYYYSKKAYNLAKETGNAEQIKESSEIVAQSSSILGNYKEAYNYHVVFKEMNDSLFNEKNINKIAGIEYQYKYEKEKREAELLQQKKEAVRIEREKKQRYLLTLFVIGFILMSLLVLFVFRSLIQKRKANSILALQKEKIRESNSELHKLNKEIRSQSTKIKATNQDLRVLNATKDKFFSIIAHDLRSPFNSLLGLSEILLKMHKEYDFVEREKILKSFNSSIVGTYKLLENLLAWSLSQSGRIQFSPKKLNLNELLLEILTNLQESANKKDIRIINTIPDNEIVYADKNMIATVFRNLISNAIEFTNSGQHVTLSVQKQTNSKYHKISITDTGVGIPKEKIDDLFRLDKNTSTRGTKDEKGTGLGLIICKEFVEKHGGKIGVESEVNIGTTFSFLLPNQN